MKVNLIPQLLDLAFEAKVTPALVGTSGIAKTSIPKQYGIERGYDRVIVLRPSVVADRGDLVGLPDFTVVEDGKKVTSFMAPDWLPRNDEKCLVIIDEINRCQPDIMMALFDAIEAEHPKLGPHSFPKGTNILATMNPPTDDFNGVTNFDDQAFLTRLVPVKIVPDFEAWAAWGRANNTVGEHLLGFLSENPEFTTYDDGGFEVESLGIKFKSNYRSKEKISRVYDAAKKLNTPFDVTYEAIRGLSNKDFAFAFLKYAEEIEKNVSIEAVFKGKLSESFDYKSVAIINNLLNSSVEYVKKNSVNDKHLSNFITFFNKVPLDIKKGYINLLLDGDQNNLESEEENRLRDFYTRLFTSDGMDLALKETAV